MKKRPSLVLREPVKLYDANNKVRVNLANLQKVEIPEQTEQKNSFEQKEPETNEIKAESKTAESKPNKRELVREKMSPRIQQIWDYFCRKAREDKELTKSFNLTRAEVMKEAGIGSTNTYRDALKKFQELNLIEIELRPGVNSGSIFTLTDKGMEQI